jgi:Ca-activated chloride channel family protein
MEVAAPMSFDHPWILILAAVLPALVALGVWRNARQRRDRLRRLGDPAVVTRLVPGEVAHAAAWRAGRLALVCALAAVALAGPRWGMARAVDRSRGFDMVLALDASLSMMATDVKPNRLERMKQEVRRLRAMSGGDRIGLIVFAGRSYVLSPLTVDEGALDLFLDNLDPSIVGQPGSSLSAAIRQGTDLLSLGTGGEDRALVVMSDGEAFEPEQDVVAAARRAGDQGISLVTVGFGTTEGSTIPVVGPNGTVTRKRDQDQQVVITHYVPTLLRAAADAAHGTFIAAGATDKAARVRQALSTLRARSRTTLGRESQVPRYQWFLMPAVLLLLLDGVLVDRRGQRRAPAVFGAGQGVGAAAALLLVSFMAGCTGTRTAARAAEAYQQGQYAMAESLYRNAIVTGDQRPRTIYGFGTTLLQLDSSQAAIEALERVVDLPDAELRYRAQFNLGLAHLKRGLDSTRMGGSQELDAALASYQQVLLMRSNDLDAKWNYELALRARQSGGGGGGGGGQGGAAPTPAPRRESSMPRGGLGLQQAEQLLASAAREERDVQARQQHARSADVPPGRKDW